MTEPFATQEDLVARGAVCPAGESLAGWGARIGALLEDASQLIRDEARGRDLPGMGTLKRVTCAMVLRALAAEGAGGLETLQEGAGSFQRSVKFFNPGAALYLTKAERRTLGLTRATAFSVCMTPGRRSDGGA